MYNGHDGARLERMRSRAVSVRLVVSCVRVRLCVCVMARWCVVRGALGGGGWPACIQPAFGSALRCVSRVSVLACGSIHSVRGDVCDVAPVSLVRCDKLLALLPSPIV